MVGSDGLFDNVPQEVILEEIIKLISTSDKLEPIEVADRLGNLASSLAHDRNYDSPFSQHARQNGKNFTGGKVDDITVSQAVVDVATFSTMAD